MINDKESLDWRILKLDDLFIHFKDQEDEMRQEESFEEDPELLFNVDNLNLLGILYCKCEPKIRVTKFYELLQPGLEE